MMIMMILPMYCPGPPKTLSSQPLGPHLHQAGPVPGTSKPLRGDFTGNEYVSHEKRPPSNDIKNIYITRSIYWITRPIWWLQYRVINLIFCMYTNEIMYVSYIYICNVIQYYSKENSQLVSIQYNTWHKGKKTYVYIYM